MVISISDIRRENDLIRFDYYTNTDKNSLCKLMSKNGVTRNSMIIQPGQRRTYTFGRTDRKREYLLQCLLGDDVSIRSGSYFATSPMLTVPKEKIASKWALVRLVAVVLFVGGGLLGVVVLFMRPEFFDKFFTPYVKE